MWGKKIYMKKISVVLVGGLLLLFAGCGKSSVVGNMSDFQVPAGFVWEGSYATSDDNGQASLTIEKGVMGYDCAITTSDNSFSNIESFEFTSKEDESNGLSYTDGKRSYFEIPDFEKNPEASVINEEIYSDGTGCLYYLGGKLYWVDDKDDYGKNLVFEKLE